VRGVLAGGPVVLFFTFGAAFSIVSRTMGRLPNAMIEKK